jgi:hypothetical protein
VTRNLQTATSSARNYRSGWKPGAPILVVCMSLQPRSLIGDEDDFTFATRNIQPDGLIPNPESALVDAWMRKHIGGKSDWYDDIYGDYVNAVLDRVVRKAVDAMNSRRERMGKVPNETVNALRDRVIELLPELFLATYTRLMAHVSDRDTWKRSAERAASDAAYARGLRAGEQADVAYKAYSDPPPQPTVADGERMYREAVDKLTRTLKGVTRTSDKWSTARSLNPIKFKGANRIIAIVEIRNVTEADCAAVGVPHDEHKYNSVVEIKFGTPPKEFWDAYRESQSDKVFVMQGGKLELRVL